MTSRFVCYQKMAYALRLFFLCITLSVVHHAHANNLQATAPKHIQNTNKELIISLQPWLDQALKKSSPNLSTPQYTITSIFTKKHDWESAEQSPIINIEPPSPWYQKILDYFTTEEVETRSTEQNTIDNITIIISFVNAQHNNLFSNEMKFKLRKYIYLHLTTLNYTPNFIAVSSQPKPVVPIPIEIQPSDKTQIVKQIIILTILFILLVILIKIIFYRRKKKQGSTTQKKPNQEKSEDKTTNPDLENNNTDTSPYPSYAEIENPSEALEEITANSTQHSDSTQFSTNDVNTEIDSQNPSNGEDEAQLSLQDNSESISPNIVDIQQALLQNLKKVLYEKILSSTSKHPYFLRKIYELWQQNHDALTHSHTPYLGDKIAIIYDILGEKVIQKTIPIIEFNHLIILKERAQSLNNIIDQWELAYQEIQQDIEKLEKYLDNPDPYQNPFGFIKAMPDQAIVLLLSDKAQHIQSITLAQFDVARCQSLALHIASNPQEHQKITQQIEHYRQYDGYFFQDVAGYLAYSLTQIIFKDNTIPLDSVSEKYAEEQSKSETQRALGDLQRQQNLGFNTQQPQITPQQSLFSNDAAFKTTNKNNQSKSNDDFVFHKEPDNLNDENLLNPEQTDIFQIEPETPHQEEINTPIFSPQDNEYTLTKVNKNSLANEWFDFGENDKKTE